LINKEIGSKIAFAITRGVSRLTGTEVRRQESGLEGIHSLDSKEKCLSLRNLTTFKREK
jgi:hypothetical protein